MNTVPGYAMSSWETGYGDFEMKPDFDDAAAGQLDPGNRDVHGRPALARRLAGGRLAAADPEGAARPARPSAAGTRSAATELEFIIFRDTYEEAWHKAYRDLEPGNLYNVDYSILGTSRLEPLLGRIRREMAASDLPVENSKGECNFGQHEINFRYADAVGAGDMHTIYKNAAKEIASLEGMSISFMAKYDEREGNSCHIHLSLRSDDDSPVFADDDAVFESFLAGQLACLRELTLFLAPNVNSYKRYAAGSFAPTAVAWGRDNRTCAFRVIGDGPCAADRVPGAGRRRQPVPRPGGADRRRAARGRRRARARADARGQRLHVRQAARPVHAARGARAVRCLGRWRARRSARRSSRTTSTTPTSSSRRSRPPSRTGSASGGSSGCEAGHRAVDGARASALGSVGRRRARARALVLGPGPGGRRDRRAAAAGPERRRGPGAVAGPARRPDHHRRSRRRPRRVRRRGRTPRRRAPFPSATRSRSRSARGAMERDLPLLGVCRGMQVMNVARGGTLIQHLPDDVGHEDHRRVDGLVRQRRPRRAAGRRLARPARGRRGDPLDQVAPPPGRRPRSARASR